jgi:hypothetical protein
MRITRKDLLKWEKTASTVEERTVFVDCLKKWNATFPGDLEISLLYGRSLIEQGEIELGREKLQEILTVHPEYESAYEALYKNSRDEEEREFYYEFLTFFQSKTSQANKYQWADRLTQVKLTLSKGGSGDAEKRILDLLQEFPDNVLIAMYHLRIILESKDDYSILQFAKLYHEKWKRCVFFMLIYADSLFKFGSDVEAISIIREAVYNDHLGLVTHGLWGPSHKYAHLWPDINDFSIEKEENSLISSLLVKEPQEIKQKKVPNRRIKKYPEPQRKGIFTKPVYVILTTRCGIEKKYGENTFAVVLSRLQELASSINLQENWSALSFLPDDKNNMLQYGLTAIESNDPWQIKLALHDLSAYLHDHDKKIGALLIIGGDAIVPFHRLPNPTDDSDSEVLSDNPYATDDSNYFVPEWAVGRFPDEKGSDPGLLLKQLREAIQWHQKNAKKKTFIEKILDSLRIWDSVTNLFQEITEKKNNYGYSTAIWQRSSISAFRPIGKANFLRISPPYNVNNLDTISIKEAEYAYFNLHGLDDSPNWYGQKDISNTDFTPDYPVALQPSQIDPQATNPTVIFSEACYGAYIIGKISDDALSLRFLTSGCRAFIGSTCIAYGSVYPPLIGADQFAYLFWNLIERNYSVGDAFIRAKLNLVKSILRRQGYLDGEDQKTLLSFVLYGDPLYYSETQAEDHLIQDDEKVMDPYQIIKDQDLDAVAVPKISSEILMNIKEVVKEYLPGIESADLSIREKQMKVINMVRDAKGAVTVQNQMAGRVFLTYKKSFQIQNKTVNQYTRVTLDEQGKMIKFSVSK